MSRTKLYAAVAIVSFLFNFQSVKVKISPLFKNSLLSNIMSEGKALSIIKEDGKSYYVDYTFKQDYQKFLNKLLKRHSSDYAVAVIVSNDTGKVLALGSYSKKEKKQVLPLAFSATHPSASLVKIVSVANLIENSAFELGTDVVVQGKGTTLYKYQLGNHYKWHPRHISLKRAFSLSNNPAIAKATINNTNAMDFIHMANNFGYQQKITQFLDLPKAKMPYPRDQYHYAELSSGFNTEALITPLHAVYFPFIIANEGKKRFLRVVNRILGPEGTIHHSGEKIIDPFSDNLMSSDTAMELKSAMNSVISSGTGKRISRGLSRRVKDKFILGGKTGSITGGEPHGKRDWFAGYAIPKDSSSKGISFAVMHINQKKWYVRSTYIAKNIIEYYYRDLKRQNAEKKEKHVAFK